VVSPYITNFDVLNIEIKYHNKTFFASYRNKPKPRHVAVLVRGSCGGVSVKKLKSRPLSWSGFLQAY